MKKEQLIRLRGQADAAMAALCSVPLQGPVIIPIGRAMEAVSGLAAELRELKPDAAGEDDPGEEAEKP